MRSIDYAERADAHERVNDFDHAAEDWFRAATALRGNPRNLRSYYHEREDAAKAKAKAMAALETCA
jgi:hypothetical protein